MGISTVQDIQNEYIQNLIEYYASLKIGDAIDQHYLHFIAKTAAEKIKAIKDIK